MSTEEARNLITKDTLINNTNLLALVDGSETALHTHAAAGNYFKTITGITNDVVADTTDDTLTLASANARLTIVGTTATDTITFTADADLHNYDWTSVDATDLKVGSVTQAYDAELTSLAALSYVAASFVKMTGAATFALRTIGETADDLEGTIDHDNLANTHNLTTDISHDSIADVSADDHHAESHTHDGDTLQLDGINSDGGAFAFTTSGAITFNQNLIIPDGGTIGQAAGPLLAFDDTNNYLEITGCNTGFGTTSPDAKVEISDSSGDEVAALRLTNTSTGVGDNVSIAFKAANLTNPAKIIGIAPGGSDIDLAFVTTNSATASEAMRLTGNGGLFLKEIAAADGDKAAFGQIWVKTVTPNELWFTDDAGTDVKLSTGGQYVDRGDVSVSDFDEGDTPTEGSWTDLDLGSGGLGIVPANAKAVALILRIKDGTLNKHLGVRKNGYSAVSPGNVSTITTQASTIPNYEQVVVGCDSSGIIEYYLEADIDEFDITVTGWFA